MDADTKSSDAFTVKDMLLFIPIFGTAIAISFDVGFFTGIGVAYFTLFSLSEHIVFALQALPIALSLAAVTPISIMIGKGGWNFRKRYQVPESTEKAPSEEVEAQLSKVQRGMNSLKARFFAISFLFFVMIFVGYFVQQSPAIVMIALCLAVFFLLAGLWLISMMKPVPLAVSGIIASLLISFATGLDSAFYQLRKTTPLHTLVLDNSEMRGLMIVGGERGVLFFETDKREMSFQRWNSIKRVTSVVAK